MGESDMTAALPYTLDLTNVLRSKAQLHEHVCRLAQTSLNHNQLKLIADASHVLMPPIGHVLPAGYDSPSKNPRGCFTPPEVGKGLPAPPAEFRPF